MNATVPWLLSILGPHAGRLAGSVALLVVAVGASVALMGTSGWLIATSALHPSIAALQLSIVGVRFFGITRAVARYAERLLAHDATLRVLSCLRVAVFRGLAAAVPRSLRTTPSGDALARLVGDIESVEHAGVRVVGPIVAALSVGVMATAAIARIHADLGIALAAGYASAAFLAPLLSWRAGRVAGRTAVRGRAELNSQLVDVLQGAPDILGLGAQADALGAISHTSRRLAAAQASIARSHASGAALVGLLADLTALAVLAAGTFLVRDGHINGVALTAAVLVTLASFEAVVPLASAFHAWPATEAAADRVRALAPVVDVAPDSRTRDARAGVRSLEVHDLSFAYPDATAPALSRVSFAANAGDVVAIVGESGAGKSTVANVLLRWWDPPPASVFIDGRDVLEEHPDATRGAIAWMSQRADVFTGTVAENVRIGRTDASDDDVLEALRAAGLGEALRHWPLGLQTPVGERGMTLSGGERQRLALSRLVVRRAPIVILDEPTSQVDGATEQQLTAAFMAMARQERRTVLLITHRVTQLADCSEILVMHEGRVVERGDFRELAGWPGGRFARMLARQRGTLR